MSRIRSSSPVLVLLPLLLLAILPACGGSASGSGSKSVSLVAYSTPREAYGQIIPAFAETPAGEGVEFDESYGASGEQARAVLAGLRADLVAFSLEPDMTKLVDEGLVAGDWNHNEHDGMVTDSLVVFVVRPGNPKKITSWDDLLEPGVDVVTPNPFTSGGAMWNIMAAYGAWRDQGESHEQALAKLQRLFENVSVQDKSAREALQTYTSGKGDVLLAYENEAIFAREKGESLDYVLPPATILIENPVAVTVDGSEAAQDFLDFLYTPEAQRIYAENGYRPVVKSVMREFEGDFPIDLKIFTIADLGGWAKVKTDFFDPESGAMAEIERAVGGKTG